MPLTQMYEQTPHNGLWALKKGYAVGARPGCATFNLCVAAGGGAGLSPKPRKHMNAKTLPCRKFKPGGGGGVRGSGLSKPQTLNPKL